MKNKTFIRITNKQIYEKLESIDKRLGKVQGFSRAHTLAISIIIVILVAIISKML